MGIGQAEGVPFAVSPRNSAAAVAYLLEKTNVTYLLLAAEFKPLADEVLASMKNPPPVAYMPTFRNLFPEKDEDFEFLPQIKHRNINDPITMLHSSGKPPFFSFSWKLPNELSFSGSTAFPKPITYTHLLFQCASRVFCKCSLMRDRCFVF